MTVFVGQHTISSASSAVEDFWKRRKEARLARWNSVMRPSQMIGIFGLSIYIAGEVVFPFKTLPGQLLLAGSHPFVAAGLLGITTCPSDEFDLNEFAERSLLPRVIFCCGGIPLLARLAAQPPIFFIFGIGVVPCVLGAISCAKVRSIKWWPYITTWIAFAITLNRLGPASVYLRQAGLHEGTASKIYIAACVVNLAGGMLTICIWCLQHFRFVHSRGTQGLSPTVNAYLAIYGYATTTAFSNIIIGAVRGWHFYVMGACLLMPPIVVLAIGRERFFGLVAKQFNSDAVRIMNDGAFVATLLDYSSINVDNDWWVHRTPEEGSDLNYPPLDPRRNWKLGCITEINENEFVVTLRPRMTSLRTVQGKDVICDGSMFQRLSIRTPDEGEETHDKISRKKRIVKIPMRRRRTSTEDILSLGNESLRCIEWSSITKQLMSASQCGTSGSGLYGLSRPLWPDEVIDFFMSHSWHDNAELKWKALTKIAEDFHGNHGRFPTFWLDKVCIDQNNIADGLRVLPINICACEKMLILCGETYPKRLWCAWEVCTLFSIIPQSMASKRINFVPLADANDSEKRDSLRSELTNFDYMNARCYDPNEEYKLQSIISTLGSDFNQRLQKIFKEHTFMDTKAMDTE